MKFAIQSLVLILSFASVYLWEKTSFSDYTIPTLGFLIFVYLVIFGRKKRKIEFRGGTWNIFLLNTVILLLVFSTGGIPSPVFFLLYFLEFGVSFVFKPTTVFIFALGAIAIFIPEALVNNSMENFIKLGSLLFISPLAFFFGREYMVRDEQEKNMDAIKERAKDAADTIASDVDEVLKNEKASLEPKDVEKLNEILEETEDLRLETKEK